MRWIPFITFVAATAGCTDGRAHGYACAKIQPTDTGWWFVQANEGHNVVGAQHAAHGETEVVLWEEPFKDITLEWTRKSRLRRLNWRFRINGGQYRTMRLQFRRNLGGLKVDATAYTDTGAALELLDGKRIHDPTIDVTWPDVNVRALVIQVHLHLHDAPVIEEFRVGYKGPLWSIPSLDPSFSNRNAAYFYDDGLGERELCRRRLSSVQMEAKAIMGHTAREAKLAPTKRPK